MFEGNLASFSGPLTHPLASPSPVPELALVAKENVTGNRQGILLVSKIKQNRKRQTIRSYVPAGKAEWSLGGKHKRQRSFGRVT